MKLLAFQPYVQVRRVVSSIDQTEEEELRELQLYDDRIKTKYREFPIADVLDMSYRPIGKSGGLLYLHTLKGVYSYYVLSSPKEFIDVFYEHPFHS